MQQMIQLVYLARLFGYAFFLATGNQENKKSLIERNIQLFGNLLCKMKNILEGKKSGTRF